MWLLLRGQDKYTCLPFFYPFSSLSVSLSLLDASISFLLEASIPCLLYAYFNTLFTVLISDKLSSTSRSPNNMVPADEKKEPAPQLDADLEVHRVPLDAVPKSRWDRIWPVIACGAGLFSDGYLNGVRRERKRKN
jgi:hypothetical protein